ncbi:MAG: universal stress protein [Chitinophagaceae bacterium]|nr:universal stress protein [Chitinophagaceae bacterium]
MKKRFILLIDFSEYTDNLIKYACDWSKQANAELILVHQSITLIPGFTDSESRQKIVELNNNKDLQKLKELAARLIPSTMKVSYLVSENHLQTLLTDLLAEPHENLIFAAIKGTGIIKQIFLGSFALEVIENINNIIVAMPKEISVFSHEKIFVAITEKYPLNIIEFNRFLNFFENENTCITFFYLAKPDEKTEGIEKQLNDLSILYADRFETKTAIFKSNNPFEDIKKIINNKEKEILIIQKGSRFFTDQLFRLSLINELVYEGQTPLIILP